MSRRRPSPVAEAFATGLAMVAFLACLLLIMAAIPPEVW